MPDRCRDGGDVLLCFVVFDGATGKHRACTYFIIVSNFRLIFGSVVERLAADRPAKFELLIIDL